VRWFPGIPVLSSGGVPSFLCWYHCMQGAVFYSVRMELSETTVTMTESSGKAGYRL